MTTNHESNLRKLVRLMDAWMEMSDSNRQAIRTFSATDALPKTRQRLMDSAGCADRLSQIVDELLPASCECGMSDAMSELDTYSVYAEEAAEKMHDGPFCWNCRARAVSQKPELKDRRICERCAKALGLDTGDM